MNILGFVFCILAVLSIEAYFAFEKKAEGYRLRATYVGHIGANREIMNQVASQFYNSLKVKPKEKNESVETSGRKEHSETHTSSHLPPFNPNCARLNLAPLIEEALNQDPYLYEAAAKLFRMFYGESLFEGKSRAEYKFLGAFLKAMREQMMERESSVLEKVSFRDSHFQKLYYQMLKGTKDGRIPSLLEYIKVEKSASKICLHHAHPALLSVFFTPKGGALLFQAIHTPKAPPITRETIEEICRDAHAPLLDPELLDLFEIQKKKHPEIVKNILIGRDEETRIFLKKTLTVSSSDEANGE